MLSRAAIDSMGFAGLGENVMLSDKASFHGVSRISIGSNVRIDDFCILSAGAGGICIGNFVHIGAYSSLIGACKITLSDFCNLSSRVSVYSSNDDYSGATMTNPMVPSEFTGVRHDDVMLRRHAIVGCGSVILPGVELEQGVAIGALTLVRTNCAAFGIYSGNPARRISERRRDLLQLEEQLMASIGSEAR